MKKNDLTKEEFQCIIEMVKSFQGKPVNTGILFFLITMLPLSVLSIITLIVFHDTKEFLLFLALAWGAGILFFVMMFAFCTFVLHMRSKQLINSQPFEYYYGVILQKKITHDKVAPYTVNVLVEVNGKSKIMNAIVPKKYYNELADSEKVMVVRGVSRYNIETMACMLKERDKSDENGIKTDTLLKESVCNNLKSCNDISFETINEQYKDYSENLTQGWHQMSDNEKQFFFKKYHAGLNKVLFAILLILYSVAILIFVNSKWKDVFFVTSNAIRTSSYILYMVILFLSVTILPREWIFHKIRTRTHQVVDGILIKSRIDPYNRYSKSFGTVCYLNGRKIVEGEFEINTSMTVLGLKIKRAGIKVWVIRDNKNKEQEIFYI